jgi:thiamine pyrophosphate-dependent acetolactate synthase large subunit-like protein
MKVYEAISSALSGLRVQTMFGVMGDANLFFVDSFVRDRAGRFVAATHEGNAVMMAKGYADTSGRLGVATVTHGPGLTNTVTALVEASRGGTPLLLIAGDTAAGDRLNIQRIVQRDVVQSTGAGFESVTSPDLVVETLVRAAHRAVDERCPIVLNVPADFQWVDVENEPHIASALYRQETRPDPDALDQALGVALNASRPLILAGNGSNTMAGRTALLELSAALGAPVATTLKAKDLFRGEAFDLGVFGTLSTDVGSEVIAASDCVLAFGASLNRWTTAEGSLLRGKRVVQVDIDSTRIGSKTRVDIGIVGAAAAVARTMCEWLAEADAKPSNFRSPELAERIASSSASTVTPRSDSFPLSPAEAIRSIDRAIGSPRTVAVDLGRAIFDAIRIMRIDRPGGLVWTADFGSIGLGTSAAIGGFMGAPDRPVLLLCGDGGFMMGGVSELSTAVRNGVDLIAVVFNDSAYGAEHIQFRNRGMDPSISTFRWPDLAGLARAMGAAGVAVRDRSDLAHAAQQVATRTGPILIDVALEVDHVPSVDH